MMTLQNTMKGHMLVYENTSKYLVFYYAKQKHLRTYLGCKVPGQS